MKNLLLALIVVLTTFYNMAAQRAPSTETVNTNSYITASPLRLLDFHAPRLRVGYIQHLTARWKVSLDLGLGSGTGLLSRRETEDDLLWEVRPEAYYILKPQARTIKYIATEFFYIGQTSTLLDNVYDTKDEQRLQFDRADYERRKYGMHLKFGLFLNFGRYWGLNMYGGFGFRWATIEFSNVTNARENTMQDRKHGYETIYDAERSDFRPNPTLGIKLFYRL